jgi:hypothetical protein
MLRKILAVMALAMCSTVFAAQTSIDVSGLSDAQVAELKAVAAKKVADAANSSGTDVGAMVTLASTWGTQAGAAAEGFAKALNSAARELGITVNDFLATDAGKITAVLIIWKVAGASIANILIGLLFIVVGQIMARAIYTRLFTREFKEVQYSYFFGLFKGTKMVRVPMGFRGLQNDGEWLAFWVMIIVSIVSMFVGAAIIT